MKKVLIYTLVFLLLFSVYQDLHVGSLQNSTDPPLQTVPITDYNAVYVKVQHGDTILSIVENINSDSIQRLDVDQIMDDFKVLNPNVNPHQLRPGHYYYFPSYGQQ